MYGIISFLLLVVTFR